MVQEKDEGLEECGIEELYPLATIADEEFVPQTRGEKVKFQNSFDDTPYESGKLTGMQMDTIPGALENLQLSFTERQVTINPWLIGNRTYDLYWADAQGNFARSLTASDHADFERGIRDWLRESRKATRQIWPQTKKRYWAWARIDDPGDSSFGKDALIPFEQFEAEREKILQRGGRPPSIKTRVEMTPGNGNEPAQA